MSDLISRQDAKDAIDMALDHIDHVPPWVYDKLLNALNEVPSAQKAQLSGEDATKDATSDLISRQAVIEAVETKIKKWNAVDGEGYHVGLGLRYTDVIDTLTELPSEEGCKCPCVYREPCDVCHYDGHLGMGCPAEEGLKDE